MNSYSNRKPRSGPSLGKGMVWWNHIKVALLCFFFLISTSLFAQETSGALTGRVLQVDGHAVAGASILAVHTPSGTRYSLATDKDGRYTLNNLRIGGPYTVTVSMVGMQSDTRTDIQIRLGAAQELNLQVQEGSQALGEVAVTGRAQR